MGGAWCAVLLCCAALCWRRGGIFQAIFYFRLSSWQRHPGELRVQAAGHARKLRHRAAGVGRRRAACRASSSAAGSTLLLRIGPWLSCIPTHSACATAVLAERNAREHRADAHRVAHAGEAWGGGRGLRHGRRHRHRCHHALVRRALPGTCLSAPLRISSCPFTFVHRSWTTSATECCASTY